MHATKGATLGPAMLCAACSVYGPELLEPADAGDTTPSASGGTAGSMDSGVGGVGAAGGSGGSAGSPAVGGMEAGSDRCSELRVVPPPPEPGQINDPDADVGEIVLATYEIDLGDRASNLTRPPSAYLDIGLNIDGVCTGPAPSAGRCALPSFSAGAGDGPEGIDNALGAVIQTIRDVMGVAFSSPQYSTQIQAGGTNLLYRIRGYNGEQNDDQVNVAFFVGAPFASDKDSSAAPRWDGSDVWPVSSASLQDPQAARPLESPKFVDPAAYVTGGRLVASFDELTARVEVGVSAITTSRLDMTLSGAVVVCDLVLGDAAQHEARNCTLAGRWNGNHLLRQLSRLFDPTSQTGIDPLCTDAGLYTTYKEQICTSLDLAPMPQDDASAPCSALSAGIAFDTRPAALGNVWLANPLAARCPDETAPRFDCCESLDPEFEACPGG